MPRWVLRYIVPPIAFAATWLLLILIALDERGSDCADDCDTPLWLDAAAWLLLVTAVVWAGYAARAAFIALRRRRAQPGP
jgi:hypothetical protein